MFDNNVWSVIPYAGTIYSIFSVAELYDRILPLAMPVSLIVLVPILLSPELIPDVFDIVTSPASVIYLLFVLSAISTVVASDPAITRPYTLYAIFVFEAGDIKVCFDNF